MPRPRADPHKRHWRTWYSMAIWHSIRRQQLLREPLCRACSMAGRVKAATEVDHIVEHSGDWNAFITGALQSLCGDCHRRKSSISHRKSQGFDEHGEPLDPDHWWNQRR
jgi:5-methylcytosine-specific restriction enzyme A